ncbi:MAG: DUF3160 domain-containing protein [Ignavibacterium sp.]|nr:DUF3160 domain-containing protein [Ignavibacterium sp.]
MKTIKFLFLVTLIPCVIFPQSNFNIQLYKEFLQSHQNMNTEQLLQMHPAGSFIGDLNLTYDNARYFDSIKIKYGLTEYEESLINQNGFVVSERLSKVSFGEAFLDIFHKDLPVYVSTDAILHAFHISYDRILTDIELGILIPRLKTLLAMLHSDQYQLAIAYSSYAAMEKSLKDVDVYLTVPLKLLGESVDPYYSSNQPVIANILNKIELEQPDLEYLFSDNCKKIDWSQFKPRGHYTSDIYPQLAQYFRAMMWLGRTELYLSVPSSTIPPIGCEPQTFQDIQRQIIDAVLINELLTFTNSWPVYEEIEDIISFFVGEQDNVTIEHISYLKDAVNLTSALNLLDSLKVVEFQDTLANQSFAAQLILSQILYSNPMSPDSIKPASAFLLFGQRFVIDSYVTATVVYDRIKYLGQKICRLFPSTLDVLFAMGNSASAQLLQNELNQYHYSSNLAALRYLIDSYDDTFWNSSLYNIWLSSVRGLNPAEDRTLLPDFMQTAAFWQKQMNTQLSSWTELRHDNLLYAKQSYTGSTICSYPYGFVEPFPEFYQSLKTFSTIAINKLQTLNFPDPQYQSNLVYYFNHLYAVADTLKSISLKELQGIPLSQEEKVFLTKIVYSTGNMSGPKYDGWYSKLFYSDEAYEDHDGLMKSDYLVADIHTTPTDCFGGEYGWISHVGTGPTNLGVIVTDDPDGILTAYVGPMMSYYEYRTEDYLRLTDEEWNDSYLQSALRPEWVNIYLADSSGNTRGYGPSLITSVEIDYKNSTIPQSQILISNYPNPFNASTIITFTIPYDLTNSLVELNIFDVQGRLIKSIINEQMPAGNYLVRWEGDNDKGAIITSGVYFYNLKVSDRYVNGKMVMVK